MAAKTNCQFLSELRKSIRVSEINKTELYCSDFCVLRIERYLSDPKHVSQLGSNIDPDPSLDVIQVTLADTKNKMKALLSPLLNKLAQTGQLQAGSNVCITGARLRYDETDMSGTSIVIIEALTVTGVSVEWDQSDVDRLSWCSDCGHLEQLDIPITSSRGYFISLWSTKEMDGNVWQKTVDSFDSLGIPVEEVYTIKELSKKWQSCRVANPALLVRVMLKSRMLHYVKPDKNDKWPFQAHLVVADRSGGCTAVLWNAMCPKNYFAVKEGTILLLRKFTMKQSYRMMPRFKQLLPDLDLNSIDLNLNSHHPVSEVKVIDPDAVPGQLELPSLTYNLVNRQQAACLPEHFICDIVGVVTYIGRYERELMASKHGYDSGDFWVRRWLHLVDNSCGKPFIVQLYRVAEGIDQPALQPGCVLLCTHMRIVQHRDSILNSHSQRYTYLTTTAETEITVLDASSARSLSGEPLVDSVMQWSVTRTCKDMLEHSLLGGHFTYPPLPTSLDAVKDFLEDTPVLASEEWERVLTNLSYREGRQLVVQATIVHASLHVPRNHGNRSSSGKSPRKKRKASQYEVTLDPDLYVSDESVTSLGSGQLGGHALPVVYRAQQWTAVRHRLDFPATDVSKLQPENIDNDDLEVVDVPYFTITWLGLNKKILLKTHLLCSHNVVETTQFTDLMAGEGFPHSPYFTQQTCTLPTSQLESVLLTARLCVDKRFVLVLDCYQQDALTLDIFLTKGLSLSSQ